MNELNQIILEATVTTVHPDCLYEITTKSRISKDAYTEYKFSMYTYGLGITLHVGQHIRLVGKLINVGSSGCVAIAADHIEVRR